ncbi:MAG: efflux RND transporter periplasmic adaptor subunit [Gammaproteobacteria bacterium]|nr:efflux RND transporter periplasmic adaptor subunit [Gammaproteobacteria bacterium]
MKNKDMVIRIGFFCIILLVIYGIFTLWNHKKIQLTLYGNVDIRDVDLAFRVSGRLIELKVDEGDDVSKGELIARLDPDPYEREVKAGEATVKQQKAALDYAQTVYQREKELRGTGASSADHYQGALSGLNQAKANLDMTIAQLSQSNLRLQDTYLYSPSDGYVLTRAVEPGTMLPANATVITVSLVNPVWVRAYVEETELSKAKPGTTVQVYADSLPNKSYQGKIGFVSSTAEFTPKTVETTNLRTELVYRLRIVVQDPHHDLRQGMPVTVKIVSD